MEQRQERMEKNLRLLLAAEDGREGVAATVLCTCRGGAPLGTDRQGSAPQEDDDGPWHRVERDLQTVSRRTVGQLDLHGAAIASLRVRTDGQEARLCAMVERLNTIISPPIEALRSEFAQLRESDKHDVDIRIDHLTRRVQAGIEAAEEGTSDSRDRLRDMSREIWAPAVNEVAQLRSDHEQIRQRMSSMSEAVRRYVAAETLRVVQLHLGPLRIDINGGVDKRLPPVEALETEVCLPQAREHRNTTTFGGTRLEDSPHRQRGASADVAAGERVPDFSPGLENQFMDTFDQFSQGVEMEGLCEQVVPADRRAAQPLLRAREEIVTTLPSVNASVEQLRHELAELQHLREEFPLVSDRLHQAPTASVVQAVPGMCVLPDVDSFNSLPPCVEKSLEQLQLEFAELQQLRQEFSQAVADRQRQSLDVTVCVGKICESTRELHEQLAHLREAHQTLAAMVRGHSFVQQEVQELQGRAQSHEEANLALREQLEALELVLALGPGSSIPGGIPEIVARVAATEETTLNLRKSFEQFLIELELTDDASDCSPGTNANGVTKLGEVVRCDAKHSHIRVAQKGVRDGIMDTAPCKEGECPSCQDDSGTLEASERNAVNLPRLETQVDMLWEQMAVEVRKLSEHQWGLRELEDLPSQLEEQVEELGRQVAGELAQLSEYHKVLHAGRDCQFVLHTDESEQREASA